MGHGCGTYLTNFEMTRNQDNSTVYKVLPQTANFHENAAILRPSY